MSMFHELMMRKKEQIMYATIKGTLTENDGVFSGFSTSNYLRIQNTITNIERTEIVLDYTIGSNLNNTGMSVFSSQEWGIQLYKPTNSDTKYKLNLGGSGTSGTHEFSANEHIRIKILVENNYLYIYYYDFSNNDWILDITYPPNDYTWSQKNKTQLSNIIFGDNQTHSGTRVFTGSMNLNNSYIKINSTKYNLQAVVGYTIVGSPTISDGVVSGFSSANRIVVNKAETNVNSVEFVAKVGDIPATLSKTELIFGLTGRITLRVYLTSSKNLRASYKDVNNTTRYMNTIGTFSSNYVKFLFNSNEISLYVSDNGIDWIRKAIGQYSPAIPNAFTSAIFGYENSSYLAFSGSIDLKETYIKVNNKLWFNGQEA